MGNASIDGDSGFNHLFGPGRVTRDLAERFLAKWGTALDKKLGLPEPEILQLYDTMIGNKSKFKAMRSESYTKMTQKWSRSIQFGSDFFQTSFANIQGMEPDPYFINAHHRFLFWNRYTKLYEHLFEGYPRLRPKTYDLSIFNLKMMYPKLHGRWCQQGLI